VVCTFFGHSDTPDDVADILRETICDLIENHGVCNFYVGKYGKFDFMARRILKEICATHPHVKYSVVLAYMPNDYYDDYSDTIHPEEIAETPKRFAINAVNKWMINSSEFVATYVCRSFGGAAMFKEVAERKGKKVINLAEIEYPPDEKSSGGYC